MSDFQNPGLANTLAKLKAAEAMAAARVDQATASLDEVLSPDGPLAQASARFKAKVAEIEEGIADTLRFLDALAGDVLGAVNDTLRTLDTAYPVSTSSATAGEPVEPKQEPVILPMPNPATVPTPDESPAHDDEAAEDDRDERVSAIDRAAALEPSYPGITSAESTLDIEKVANPHIEKGANPHVEKGETADATAGVKKAAARKRKK